MKNLNTIMIALMTTLVFSCEENDFFEKNELAEIQSFDDDHNKENKTDERNEDKGNIESPEKKDSKDNDLKNSPPNKEDDYINNDGSDSGDDDSNHNDSNSSGDDDNNDDNDSGDNDSDNQDNDNGDDDNNNDDSDSGNNDSDNNDNNSGDEDSDNHDNDSGDDDNNSDDNDNGDDNGDKQTMSISETFNQSQAEEAMLDILWVIDDSGSMGPDQANLAYNFQAFIQQFINRNLDYRMAITTTDTRPRGGNWWQSGWNGEMVCPWQSISAGLAQVNPQSVIDNFIDCAMVGTHGSVLETGLEAVEKFIGHYGPNPSKESFLRDDAYFIIIVLADEDDQSPRSSGQFSTLPVDHYLDIAWSTKANNGLVKFYSIVFMDESQREHSVESIGSRFMEASDKTGGAIANIKDNFYNILTDISNEIINLSDSFALSYLPYKNLEVRVNGDKTSPSDWRLNESSMSIRFEEHAIPEADSTIEISYEYILN